MEFAELIKAPKVDNVILHRPLHEPTEVVLCITGHHIILSSRSSRDDEVWILHVMVDSLERRQSNKQNSLIIKSKNFRSIQLDIRSQEDLKSVADSIDWLSNLDDPRLMYPFYYCRSFEVIEDGWQTFELDREYRKILQSTDEWRISNANNGYKLCATYPEKILVPKSISDESLVKVAQFRCMGRFPVLSYLHKANKAVILRSGQPMIGPSNRRCKEDERLLTAIIGSQRGHIIDTRHENIAQLARTKGGGHEPETHYPLMRRCHKPIARYNTLVDSLKKLVEGCQDKSCTTEKWISTLENSNWLGHLQNVMECACVVAQCIDHEGASVLVHGSEGMDSTLQVCSLAQIILDPDCRTVQGFEALIEREWLQPGHPFSTRCKHSAYAPTTYGNSDKHHAYGSEFGTFLGNCQREREEFDVVNRTTSLWSYINRPDILEGYLNPVYDPNEKAIWPSVAAQSLELWENVFLRWSIDMKFKFRAKQRLKLIRAEQKKLRAEGDQLRLKLESSNRLQGLKA